MSKDKYEFSDDLVGDDVDAMWRDGIIKHLEGYVFKDEDPVFKSVCEQAGFKTVDEAKTAFDNAKTKTSKYPPIDDNEIYERAQKYAIMTTDSSLICPRHLIVAAMAIALELGHDWVTK